MHIALLFAFAGVLLTVDGLGVVLAANVVETNPNLLNARGGKVARILRATSGLVSG